MSAKGPKRPGKRIRIPTRKCPGVEQIVHLGMESVSLEETGHLEGGDDACQRYADGSAKDKLPEDWREIILKLKPQDVKRFWISRQVLSCWKGRIRKGTMIKVYGKTRTRLKRAMQKMINHSKDMGK